jgi:DNA topoisomerase VI subunit B
MSIDQHKRHEGTEYQMGSVGAALTSALPRGRRPRRELKRETFKTSRLLEYFSQKELTLQTGHEPNRWPEVVLKELLDNALDACEEAGTLPEITVSVTSDAIRVEDNGPGLASSVIEGVLDFAVRTSSKDHYISPTRGAQGNALKTLLGIPYVLSDGHPAPIAIASHGKCYTITVSLDRIAQQPQIHLATKPATVKTGTSVEVPVSTLKPSAFVPLVQGYSCFNPHATIVLEQGTDRLVFARTTTAWTKWRPSDPTSPHWYTAEQLRNLIAAYVHQERQGGSALFVRDFLAQFRGLSSTVKRKEVLSNLPLVGTHLRDLVRDGDLDRRVITTLLKRMQDASKPVPPTALGVLGDRHLKTWLETYGGKVTETFKYKRAADVSDASGLPFVVEVAFVGRKDRQPRRLVTGLNFAPTLVDPFRAFKDYGLGLDGLLSQLMVEVTDPVTVVVHLTSPHLRFSDRGKSSLEAV